MTLTTSIHLYPDEYIPDLFKVWATCAAIANVPESVTPDTKDDSIESPISIGAKAWIGVYFSEGDSSIRVMLDTAYTGDGSNTHNAIVKALMASFPTWPLVAHNEFNNTWHPGPPYQD